MSPHNFHDQVLSGHQTHKKDGWEPPYFTLHFLAGTMQCDIFYMRGSQAAHVPVQLVSVITCAVFTMLMMKNWSRITSRGM